ncbi:hypothetical protein FRX31_013138, partial [Thalictrum thalictroides]
LLCKHHQINKKTLVLVGLLELPSVAARVLSNQFHIVQDGCINNIFCIIS